MFSPANHPSLDGSQAPASLPLKIAGLSFAACAGQRVEMGRGWEQTQYQEVTSFISVYSAVQCLQFL